MLPLWGYIQMRTATTPPCNKLRIRLVMIAYDATCFASAPVIVLTSLLLCAMICEIALCFCTARSLRLDA